MKVRNAVIRYTYEKVKEELSKRGYYLKIKKEEFKGITTSPLYCVDKYGYKYTINYNKIMVGKKAARFHTDNVFTIDNINTFLKYDTHGDYLCVSDKYTNNKIPLKIKHVKCGRIFEASWINLYRQSSENEPNRHGTRCPFCEANQLESTHALVLKQVWLHEHPDTIVEEKSCINPLTNCSLPTDIVNHRLKIAIEVQSWFHDFEYQKTKDKIKKNYWRSLDYNFYAIDQRDYTVVNMIKLFFPHLNEIPNYIDFEYSNKIDDIGIQRMLNEGHNVSYISKFYDIPAKRIYDAIGYGRIYYPETYIDASHSPVVQLALNGKFLNKFNSISEAGRTCNISKSNISQCLQKKRNYSGGFLWFYKEDYDNGNWSIPNYRNKKFMIAVDKYDKSGNFICSYKTISEASRENNCPSTDILNVVNGERKSCYGFTWKRTV